MNTKLKYQINAPYVENLFKARGIEDINHFLNPLAEDIKSPHLLDNIEAGVSLLKECKGHSALTIVDPDADGYCASAILLNYLHDQFQDWHIDFFIHDGKNHGLEDVIALTDLTQYDIVFLPDAGSNDDAFFECYPDTHFLVLDHHLRSITEEAPKNCVIINNQLSDNYKNKALSGAGVTWQFCRACDEAFNTNYADKYIDLAAVALIGDIMDTTTTENRAIIKKGLNNIENLFLRDLIDNASYSIGSGELSPINIAFYVVPMINAMCRMGSLEEKQRMFLSFIDPMFMVECHKRGAAKGTMVNVASESIRECTNAKTHQKKAQAKMAELCDKVILEQNLTDNKIFVIELGEEFDGIPAEMNGLTATKIANDYGHPTLIGRVGNDGILKGSIRGLTTLDMPPLKEFLESSGMFEFLEGHSNAAGYGIKVSSVPAFIEWSNKELAHLDIAEKTYEVDFEFNGTDPQIEKIILDLDEAKSTWGQGNPEPVFHIKNIRAQSYNVQVMGKNSDTVKISYNNIAYMFFKRPLDEVKELIKGGNFEIVGTANVNFWGNKKTAQIFVTDYVQKDDLAF